MIAFRPEEAGAKHMQFRLRAGLCYKNRARICMRSGVELLALLGRGGVGEVFRVRDPQLGRLVALKALRPDRMEQSGEVERFVAEAKVTAQLEHPGIVPVHSFGSLDDGRPFFTMKEIKGRTLREAILAFHEEVDLDPEDQRVEVGLRRLVEQLKRACEAMAYAHERGVVHRDLKPDNIMVGPWGEVLVVDWGLCIRVGGKPEDMPGVPEALEGTLLYMAPELVGEEGRVATPASDVYSLGAVLYALLSGRAPYLGSMDAVRTMILAGPPPPPTRQGFDVPEDLLLICTTAMSRDPAGRYPDAGVLEAELGSWLEGSIGRERARRAVQQADEMGVMVERLRASALQLRERAQRALASLPAFATADSKHEAWAWEDEAERLEQEAAHCEEEELTLLRAALTHAPFLQEVHERLASHYHALHQQAELSGDLRAASHWEVLLRAHNRGRYDSWLRGVGAVSLRTEPADADVELYRVERRNRRMVPLPVRSLGRTPLRALELPAGVYVLHLHAAGFAPLRVPLRIERGLHWKLRPPGGAERPLRLFQEGEDSEHCCDVPPGAETGTWIDAFRVFRHPVTVGDYRLFLEELRSRGLEIRFVGRGGGAGAHGQCDANRTGSHGHAGAPRRHARRYRAHGECHHSSCLQYLPPHRNPDWPARAWRQDFREGLKKCLLLPENSIAEN
jgi:serine/threonine-protein kinase